MITDIKENVKKEFPLETFVRDILEGDKKEVEAIKKMAGYLRYRFLREEKNFKKVFKVGIQHLVEVYPQVKEPWRKQVIVIFAYYFLYELPKSFFESIASLLLKALQDSNGNVRNSAANGFEELVISLNLNKFFYKKISEKKLEQNIGLLIDIIKKLRARISFLQKNLGESEKEKLSIQSLKSSEYKSTYLALWNCIWRYGGIDKVLSERGVDVHLDLERYEPYQGEDWEDPCEFCDILLETRDSRIFKAQEKLREVLRDNNLLTIISVDECLFWLDEMGSDPTLFQNTFQKFVALVGSHIENTSSLQQIIDAFVNLYNVLPQDLLDDFSPYEKGKHREHEEADLQTKIEVSRVQDTAVLPSDKTYNLLESWIKRFFYEQLAYVYDIVNAQSSIEGFLSGLKVSDDRRQEIFLQCLHWMMDNIKYDPSYKNEQTLSPMDIFSPFVRLFQLLSNYTKLDDVEKGSFLIDSVRIEKNLSHHRKPDDYEQFLLLVYEAHQAINDYINKYHSEVNFDKRFISTAHHILGIYFMFEPYLACQKTPLKLAAIALGLVDKFQREREAEYHYSLVAKETLAEYGGWKGVSSFESALFGPRYSIYDLAEDKDLLLYAPERAIEDANVDLDGEIGYE